MKHPTFLTFIKLLDNYNPYIGQEDPASEQHEREQQEFLEALMDTQVMKEAYNFLKNKGNFSHAPNHYYLNVIIFVLHTIVREDINLKYMSMLGSVSYCERK